MVGVASMAHTNEVLPAIDIPSTFCVVNLGCKVNRVESDTASALLRAAGATWAPKDQASLVVVNTCTVTGEADKKTRKAVRGALRSNAAAQVVVTGCAAALDPAAFEALDPRVTVVGRTPLLAALKSAAARSAATDADAVLRLGAGFPTRVNIKVQDGCDHRCTYCIVSTARGPAQSRPFDEICREVGAYAAAGIKEVVLTGIDLGSWRQEGCGLVQLLEALREQCAKVAAPGQVPCRIRASSLEPLSVTPDLIALLAESDGAVCRHLHLPLQSGSSKVLAEMARPYDQRTYLDLVERLYARVPLLALSTDIICGFPGETDEDFQQTLAVARHARFSKIHVFPYSQRQGTPAAARSDQVPPAQREARAAHLRDLGRQLRTNDRARRAGTRELALVQTASALTESYYEIPLKEDFEVGALVSVLLD